MRGLGSASGSLLGGLLTYVEKSRFRTVGRVLAVTPDPTTVYLTVLVVATTAVALAAVVRASRLGLALAGIGADEERAQTLGVPTRRVKVAGFALSSSIRTRSALRIWARRHVVATAPASTRRR